MSVHEVDLDPERFGPAAFELFRDVFGEWRWRLRAGGRVLGMSAESYGDRETCLDRVLWVQTNSPTVPVEGVHRNDEGGRPDA
jgi:uncharacterized protein YegP (UPF0339 family)